MNWNRIWSGFTLNFRYRSDWLNLSNRIDIIKLELRKAAFQFRIWYF